MYTLTEKDKDFIKKLPEYAVGFYRDKRFAIFVRSYLCTFLDPSHVDHIHIGISKNDSLTLSVVVVKKTKQTKKIQYANINDIGQLLKLMDWMHIVLPELAKDKYNWSYDLSSVEKRCSEPTSFVVVNNEFEALVKMCKRIKEQNRKLHKMQESKNKLINNVLTCYAERVNLPVELVKKNQHALLSSCCKALGYETGIYHG